MLLGFKPEALQHTPALRARTVGLPRCRVWRLGRLLPTAGGPCVQMNSVVSLFPEPSLPCGALKRLSWSPVEATATGPQ